MIRVGTAGWQIPRDIADAFPVEGSTLQRYAACFPAVEINSSFHRPHRPATYARWAETTPAQFRFTLKLPKTITHQRKLAEPHPLLDQFLSEISGLGEKLGVLVVQLPPSLAFDPEVAGSFFGALRDRFAGALACEPRHRSWFGEAANAMLTSARVARIAADPACEPAAGQPGGWAGLRYWRLHGSPAMYRTPYGPERLVPLAAEIRKAPGPAWLFFDNTMSGAAARDALALQALLAG